MTDAEIIVALGDTAAVAKHFELAQNTVSNWKVRGIAWQFRAHVKALARRRRIKVPEDFLTTKRGAAIEQEKAG